MLTVACVLRSGGAFTQDWVVRLRHQVARHLQAPHRFVCLTDMAVPCDSVPLKNGWPGWWSKLELWRPGTFEGRVLYFDLDTLITGNITPLAGYRNDLATLTDFFSPRIAATGVLAWDARKTDNIWARIQSGPPEFKGRSDLYLDLKGDRLQDIFPGTFGSYKAHELEAGPADYSVVCFHGYPKFTDLAPGTWARDYWEAAS